jgi:hypothetical protein
MNSDKKPLYEVNIDFDDASKCWLANKRSLGGGTYRYVCAKKGKNNNMCIARCLPGEDYCKTHLLFAQDKLTNST